MRASLDTNVIIHLYRAELQGILFDLFDEGVFIYEQIRSMELEHHGQDILTKVDSDINAGKIELFTDQKLKDLAVYKMFENNSFGIYLFHQQIIYFIILIFNYILNPIITIVLSFILSITISNFMVLILQKNKFTKFIFGL